jgi:hypothetical protein
MKTVREWIDICKQTHPLIGGEWEENVKALYEKERFDTECCSMYDALNCSFTWAESTQGHIYWARIMEDMENYPSKYLTPKKKMFNSY